MHWIWEQFLLANGIVWLLLYALLFLVIVCMMIAEQDSQDLVRERVRKRRRR